MIYPFKILFTNGTDGLDELGTNLSQNTKFQLTRRLSVTANVIST